MSDHRLRISETCAQTGATKQHVAAVSMSLRLEPRGKAAKQYNQHVVTLHTSTHDPHPLLVGSFPLALGAPTPTAICLPVRVHPDQTLMARWYARAFDPTDGIHAQELIACGSLLGTEVRLVDVENRVQGVLHVSGWPFDSSKQPQRPVNKAAQALVQQVRDAYKRVTPAPGPNDKFADVQIHLEERACSMPLLFYTAHASLMRVPDRANATAYFENALHVCSGKASTHPSQLLADVLSLPSLGWIYRPDVTRTGEDADQWASLLSFPGGVGVPPAFDCEDGSKALLEILGVLQSIELVEPTPALITLQKLARQYRGYFCICELKSENGAANVKAGVGGANYLNHAMVVMLGTGLPPITLESTAYCSGAWTPDAMRTLADDEATFGMDSRKADLLLDAQGVENARIKSPISLVIKQNMYRRILALVTCSGARAEHWLLNTDLKGFLLLQGGRLESVKGAVKAVDMPLSDLLAACQAELRLVPACRFPRAPPLCSLHKLAGSTFLLPPGQEVKDANFKEVYVTDEMTLLLLLLR
jgi:hypothetical protein